MLYRTVLVQVVTRTVQRVRMSCTKSRIQYLQLTFWYSLRAGSSQPTHKNLKRENFRFNDDLVPGHRRRSVPSPLPVSMKSSIGWERDEYCCRLRFCGAPYSIISDSNVAVFVYNWGFRRTIQTYSAKCQYMIEIHHPSTRKSSRSTKASTFPSFFSPLF